jgi:hypothetical protein
MITGKDKVSIEVLDSLDEGVKLKDIPTMYAISIDQAKRLSRYRNLLQSVKNHLNPSNFEKLQQLGLKSLTLAPQVKHEDWEGMEDVLSSVHKDIKRDDLKKLILAVEEKKKRIKEFKDEVDRKIRSLEKKDKEIQERKSELIKLQQEIKKKAEFLKKYDPDVQEFLLEHLGLSPKEKKLVLAKRLDYNWQKLLKNKGVIEFIEKPHSFTDPDIYEKIEKTDYYVYVIHDLDHIAVDLKKRWKRGWDCAWNYEKAAKRNFFGWDVPEDPSYRNAEGLATDLNSQLQELRKEIMEIEKEKRAIQKEMKDLKRQSPKSFLESVEASNKMSELDLIKHGELQEQGLKWLFQQGYVCTAEFTLPNRKRADVIGYNEQGHMIILEVKVSQSDYDRDDKWDSYLPYCDEFYFLLDDGITPYNKDYPCGIMRKDRKGKIAKDKEDTLKHTAENREQLRFSIAQTLTQKNLLGY